MPIRIACFMICQLWHGLCSAAFAGGKVPLFFTCLSNMVCDLYMLLQVEDAALPDFISFLALKLFPRFKM